MRSRFLLLSLLILFLTNGTSVFSQISNKGFELKSITADSLAGFDEEYFTQMALEEGLTGEAFANFISLQKRVFIDLKYDLKKYFETPVDPNSEEYKLMIQNAINNAPLNGKLIGGGNVVNAAPCVNEGFELNNMSGWSYSAGVNVNSYAYPATPNPVTFPSSSLQIVTTPTTDPIIGAISNSPFAGNKVVKISDNFPDGRLQKINQTFPVTSTNFLYEFAYRAVSLQSPHTCSQQPYMRVVLKDFVGNLLICPNFTFASPNPTAVCSTTGITTWSLGGGVYSNPSWQKYSIDLTSYINSTITVEVILSDCVPTGHYMYSYFDSECSQLGITLNGSSFVPAPSVTVNVAGNCAQVATLTAPGGLGPYTWNGPPLSGVTNNTNQTISAPIAGLYTLTMLPPGTCLPIVRVINMSFPPPTTITASPSATICNSGTNTITTLSAFGAAQYTWQPGGSNLNIVNFTPTATTLYTLTARTGTCVGDYYYQVTVAPNPNLVVLSSNLSLCPGQTATLSASGANTYSWLPVGLTGSIVAFTQTATTTYTTIGTSTAGCISTATTAIVQTSLAPAAVIQIGGPVGIVCPGTPLTYVALNASTFTWMPAGFVGNPAVLIPTVTTNYTVIGSSGSCTNSALFTVTVDPGPSMTVTSSPTIICPGNSATLSAVAPAALGFTWSPVASNASSVVVTPAAPTVYSVSGHNALGCISTYTVAPIISPVPNLTITPATPTVCFNAPISLVGSGASTYTWLPGGLVSTGIVVSLTSNTNFTVIGSNGTCTNSAQTTVTVVPLPTVGASSSTNSICSGQTAILTATGATTYTWNPGNLVGTSVMVSPTVTTTYTVSGTLSSCDNTATVTITVNYGPTLNPVASPTAICPGGNSNISASGASSYTWNPGGLNTSNINVSPAASTIYSVTGASALGCLSNATVALTVNPAPTVLVSASSASICNGSSVSFTANGASTYTWNPGALSGSIISVSPTTTTTYTVIGANAFGCNGQNTISILVVPIPAVVPTASPNSICIGTSATLSAIGATNYTWNPGNLSGPSVIVSPSLTTTYSVIGNAAGCTGTASVLLTVLNGPTLNPVASPTAICPGGSSNLSASGATGYTWNPGGLNGANVSVSPTITTIYSVTGSNAIGCLTTNTLQVVVNSVPTISVTASSPSICAGSSVNLTASGATTYTWNPGNLNGANVTVSPASSTIYTVVGTNGFGCTGQNTISILVAPIPAVVPTASPNSICLGTSATLSAIGATNYTWNPGNLSGGSVIVSPTLTTTYTVSGSAAGCTGTASVLLTVLTGPTLNPVASPTAICPGGSSNLSASGATGYTWNPGGLNGANISVSPTITTIYSVTGSNAIGCLTTNTLQVIVNPTPTISISAAVPSICVGGFVGLTGGGAATYTWLPGGSNLSAISPVINATTTFTLLGTSSLSCVGQNTITIIGVPFPTLVTLSTPTAICAGSSATLSATGANTYTWFPGAVPLQSIVVSPGSTSTYTVAGTSSACVSSSVVTVVVNSIPVITASASPAAICPGSSSTLSATGAATYTWNPGNLIGSPVVVSPSFTTSYLVVGASAFGCTSTQTVTVIVNPVPVVSTTASAFTICSGNSTSLSAFGASTYTWNPGGLNGSNITVSPSNSTTYTVVGTNAFGCTGQNTIGITVNPTPTVGVVSTPTALCFSNCGTLTANGATTYSWSTGGSGPSVIVCPTVTTSYTVSGSALGCTGTNTITVPVNPLPSLSITASSNSLCSGTSASLSASGAASYTWFPGSITANSIVVTPSVTSTYTLAGTTAFGCFNFTTITILVSPTPTVSATATNYTICSGFSSTLNAIGASSYTWDPGSLSGSSVVVSPTITTTYTLNGATGACNSSTTVLITVDPLPNITATASPSTVCLGNSTTLTANGAASYSWAPISLTGSLVSDTPPASVTYTINGTSAAGCSSSATLAIAVITPPTLSVSSTASAVCVGNSLTLTAIGAATFTWLPGNTNGSTLVQSPGSTTTYTVYGTNGGCVGSTTMQIIVNPLPTVTAVGSSSVLCSGNSLSLTAGGALNYTWSPIALTGSLAVDNPTVSLTYSVLGEDANGCLNQASFAVTVNPNPTLSAVASSSAICENSTVTLTANGATNYTWTPTGLNTAVITDTPLLTTTYTVDGSDLNGCTATQTVEVQVLPNPTITISPISSTICVGNTVTLTANGALNYTWLPVASNATSIVESPSITTTYTVTGDNGSICSTSFTAEIIVNPLPANITTSVSGIISCAGPTVDLFGNSTSTNVSYFWSGPLSYTSAVQNPTAVNVWGDFTLVVTDNATGCISTVTVNVPTDYSIPSITLSASSSSITCAITTVTLNAANTTTNAGYNWTGPSGFTNTSQSFTTSQSGVYTITVTDLTSFCTSTATVSISTFTNVVVTSSIIPATCNGTVSNNNGTILVFNFGALDKFDLVSGASYTGSATYTTATIIPTAGIVSNTLANPSSTVAYTLRIFDSKGCIKDTTLILTPTTCSINSIGVAKSISSIITNDDGTYNMTVKTVVKNYGTVPLTEVRLDENLSNVFVSPITFTIVPLSTSITSIGSSLTLNNSFDGSTETSLTNTLTSSLPVGKTDTVIFTVRVNSRGLFGPFSNSIKGSANSLAVPPTSMLFSDSSNTGLNPDPDLDNNPSNNNTPTVFSFQPKLFFGLTKKGEAIKSDNNSFDFKYSVTVHNLGNDTLYNVIIKDSLMGSTIKQPASYSIKTSPTSTGNLVANTSFNGSSDVNLTLPAQSKMPPGAVNTIDFVINVVTNTVTTFSNSAFGRAIDSKNTVVSDTSGNGDNPDINNNGVWNEPSDNVPTILTVSNVTLFIPQGFSPDGDGKNETFIIKGLPDVSENELTIFNRWGNKVYQNTNYDNSWDGRANMGVGTGNNKLPQGTYYYILDIKSDDQKPYTGFIVIQY